MHANVALRCVRSQLESDHDMNSSRKRHDQILGVISGKRAERLLTDLANTVLQTRCDEDVRHFAKRYPEVFDLLSYSPEVTERAQKAPTLRQSVKQSFAKHGFEVAAVSLSLLQSDLRGVWDSPDGRSREWAVFVMRQWYGMNAVAHAVSGLPTVVPLPARETLPPTWLRSEDKTESEIQGKSVEEVVGMILASRSREDERIFELMRSLPPPTPMEAVLFHLQRIGDKLRHCPNPECPAPYFIASKKGQKFCSPECAAPSQRESKRKWWYENRAKGGA